MSHIGQWGPARCCGGWCCPGPARAAAGHLRRCMRARRSWVVQPSRCSVAWVRHGSQRVSTMSEPPAIGVQRPGGRGAPRGQRPPHGEPGRHARRPVWCPRDQPPGAGIYLPKRPASCQRLSGCVGVMLSDPVTAWRRCRGSESDGLSRVLASPGALSVGAMPPQAHCLGQCHGERNTALSRWLRVCGIGHVLRGGGEHDFWRPRHAASYSRVAAEVGAEAPQTENLQSPARQAEAHSEPWAT